jgi:hypothetical protein
MTFCGLKFDEHKNNVSLLANNWNVDSAKGGAYIACRSGE